MQQSEVLGREKFEDFLKNKKIEKYIFTPERYRIDNFYKHPNGSIVGAEIKNRSKEFEKYDTYIMEKNKYDFMKELLHNKKCDYCQMCYFFDDTLYIFSYRRIHLLLVKGIIKPTLFSVPDSTDNYHHHLEKTIYFLPKEHAMKY